MKPIIVILTGLSGSGKTVALRSLEDCDYYCVDNLPVALIESFVTTITRQKDIGKIAIGIDIREKCFLTEISGVLKILRKQRQTEVLFLDAEKDVLVRRFKETRRPHPLGGNVEEAIAMERERLSLLKDSADRIIDTSSYTPHQLRELVISLYAMKTGKKALTIALISFGFKFGAPQNIDLLFDARFLPNPNFVPELKALRGTDKKVAEYVFRGRVAKTYVNKIKDLLDFLIPNYIKEGRAYLTIGVGCTGGNHRSPAIVERLRVYLKKYPAELSVVHRDIA
ncbi:MAG: RNase adapter RapZ [Thermodesulfovibrionales bacterium]|nr:RNase adapter RapZ [Thermodesulfovibrionales bacterium]